MMTAKKPYIAKMPDKQGYVLYNQAEHAIWQTLITRQISILEQRACAEFLRGLDALQITTTSIPQLPELSAILHAHTQWKLEPVPALISTQHFFTLLANRQFPVATFIRRPADLDYIEEPDIFHELFGHCPLLMHAPYADFVQAYGRLSLQAEPHSQELLARLFFYTIEIGLIQSPEGLRIYGGGILSSSNESIYALESDIPLRVPFDVEHIVSHSFALDKLQKIYYVIEDFKILYELLEVDLLGLMDKLKCAISSVN